ncbi:Cullin 1a [Basidiobolus meristosporus CBS 931.73]|uniref:Cullin-5 n=1 Tax=Basidiobolus meristosporus CBS 931.73 TaxID=1314790 RepID=A0A1Y1YEW4_9FUNG|nr:Cullin 1a [Basidiobolus meristosporus CBS 931.73]|eukprot:ORX96529.1 Cullin 1a [Basidiobolus meristosporus CBS 931.73]
MSLRPKRINFEKTFTEFEKNLIALYNLFGFTKVSGMTMIQLVYDLCTARPRPYTERLFNSIANFLVERSKSLKESILEPEEIILAYAKEWDKYAKASQYTDSVCQYLNKLMTQKEIEADFEEDSQNANEPVAGGKYLKQSIKALAYFIWKEQVINEIKMLNGNRLVYQILDMIKRDRDGEEIEYQPVREAISSFVMLNSLTDAPMSLYEEEFERSHLLHTKQYYEREAASLIASKSISDYMKKAAQRLEQEILRCEKYCDPSSYPKVILECETQFITKYQTQIQSAFEEMIRNEHFDDCNLAYSLLKRISQIQPLLDIYERWVAQAGKRIIAEVEAGAVKDPRNCIESLLDLHAKYSGIVVKVFNNDPVFVAAVDKAFRSIVNDSASNPAVYIPEVLARYCDFLLKKNIKSGLNETDIEKCLNRVIVLFKYIDDKDVYQKFYSRSLAKRLIYRTSISDEAESLMITRLKDICGVEYTSKLQRMFTDMAISSDLNHSFKEFIDKNGLALGVDFAIQVLTAGAWPLSQQSPSDFEVPLELEKSVANFSTFYNAHHNGRKLNWLWHLSKAEMRFHLDRRYELSLSLHQMGIMLLFNNTDRLSYKEIQESTKLNDAELRRSLKPLIDANLFRLTESAKYEEAIFEFNSGFTSKRTKIKISTFMHVDTPQETDATRRAVEEDRKLYLQAAIVRIMKSRRTLSHTQLITEVIDQAKSRFAPSVSMIKKCIEQLLEKQYMDRSSDRPDTYLYVA